MPATSASSAATAAPLAAARNRREAQRALLEALVETDRRQSMPRPPPALAAATGRCVPAGLPAPSAGSGIASLMAGYCGRKSDPWRGRGRSDRRDRVAGLTVWLRLIRRSHDVRRQLRCRTTQFSRPGPRGRMPRRVCTLVDLARRAARRSRAAAWAIPRCRRRSDAGGLPHRVAPHRPARRPCGIPPVAAADHLAQSARPPPNQIVAWLGRFAAGRRRGRNDIDMMPSRRHRRCRTAVARARSARRGLIRSLPARLRDPFLPRRVRGASL